MKKLLSLALSLLLACSLCTALAADYSDVFTNFDLRDSWTAATEITFTDTAVTINGSGAAADGTVVTITAPGVYKLQGSCADGQVLVEIDKAEKAQLVLAGLTLTCQSSAPLYVLSADKVSLTLAPDTVNTFTDGKAYTAAFEKRPTPALLPRRPGDQRHGATPTWRATSTTASAPRTTCASRRRHTVPAVKTP